MVSHHAKDMAGRDVSAAAKGNSGHSRNQRLVDPEFPDAAPERWLGHEA